MNIAVYLIAPIDVKTPIPQSSVTKITPAVKQNSLENHVT